MAYQLRRCVVLAENPGQAASHHLELSSRDLTLYSGSYEYQPSHVGCLSKQDIIKSKMKSFKKEMIAITFSRIKPTNCIL